MMESGGKDKINSLIRFSDQISIAPSHDATTLINVSEIHAVKLAGAFYPVLPGSLYGRFSISDQNKN